MTEYASTGSAGDGQGRFGPFPAEWGVPKGSQGSQERAAWVRAKVLEHGNLTPRQRVDSRLTALRARLRLAELNGRDLF